MDSGLARTRAAENVRLNCKRDTIRCGTLESLTQSLVVKTGTLDRFWTAQSRSEFRNPTSVLADVVLYGNSQLEIGFPSRLSISEVGIAQRGTAASKSEPRLLTPSKASVWTQSRR